MEQRDFVFDVTYCYIRSRTFKLRVDVCLWGGGGGGKLRITMIITVAIIYIVYYYYIRIHCHIITIDIIIKNNTNSEDLAVVYLAGGRGERERGTNNRRCVLYFSILLLSLS